MSIKSGQRYKITNEESGLVFDQSRRRYSVTNKTGLVFDEYAGTKKSILGFDLHGLDNQQWIPEKQDDGQWTIRSVRDQEYVGFENNPDNGTAVVGIDKPQLWDIEILSESEDHDNPRVKFWIRDTLLVIEFPKERSGPAPLQLWAAQDGKNQVWVLEEYS